MENQDKMLDFILLQPSTSVWKKNRDRFPVAELQQVAQQHNLTEFENRVLAQKMVHLTIYEEALNCRTTEELAEKVMEKLQYHSYCNSYVITRNVGRKGFDVNNDLDIYRNGIQAITEEVEAKVLFWVIDICCYYILNTNGPNLEMPELVSLIEEKISPFIKIEELTAEITKKLTILKWDKFSVRKLVATKFKIYADVIDQIHAHFFNTPKAVEEEKEKVVEKSEECSLIDSLIDSICDIDISTAEKEQDLTEKAPQQEGIMAEEQEEQQPAQQVETNEPQEKVSCDAAQETQVDASDKFENALKTFCESLGYVVQKEEALRYAENKETKLIAKLLDPRIGAPLSQLYNTYNTLEHHSLDNIEAVLSTFFTSLESLGFEFNEETYKVGDTLTVNSKDAGKTFRFSKPITSDGEVEVCVEHLETLYQNKRLTQMIVKPIQA